MSHAARIIAAKIHSLCGIGSEMLYYRETSDRSQLHTDGEEGSHAATFSVCVFSFFAHLLLAMFLGHLLFTDVLRSQRCLASPFISISDVANRSLERDSLNYEAKCAAPGKARLRFTCDGCGFVFFTKLAESGPQS